MLFDDRVSDSPAAARRRQAPQENDFGHRMEQDHEEIERQRSERERVEREFELNWTEAQRDFERDQRLEQHHRELQQQRHELEQTPNQTTPMGQPLPTKVAIPRLKDPGAAQ